MKVTERRVVTQEWYECEDSKTGWDTHGWFFDCGHIVGCDWTIVDYLEQDKHYNPTMGIAEREVEI